MPGRLDVEPRGEGRALVGRGARVEDDDLGQLAAGSCSKQPRRVGGQPAGGQHVTSPSVGVLDAQRQVLVGPGGQYDAAHRYTFSCG